MLEVSSSLHTLLGWGGEVGGEVGGGGGAGTGKGDFLFRNGRRVFLVIKASIVWEWNGIVNYFIWTFQLHN